MTITEAKQLCIVDYLASIGYHAQYVKAGQYWYRSPFRQEKTPSFKVNSRLNEWYDFGAATGGDLVELGKHLYQTNSVSEVLAHIEQHIKGTVIPHVRLPSPVTQPMEPEICNMIVVPLKNHALLSYLRTRLINTDVAKMFCKEIHYELRGRKYFALGFKTSQKDSKSAIHITRMHQDQRYIYHQTPEWRNTTSCLHIRRFHGLSFLSDTETVWQQRGLY